MPNIILKYHPPKMAGVYGTNIHLKRGDFSCRIQFEGIIKYAGMMSATLSAFQISRERLLIDGKEPDEHIFTLANECSKIFFPVTLFVNEKGSYETMKFDDIQQRWLARKEELEQTFVGEGSVRYLSSLERKINEPSYLPLLIERDLFFNLYWGIIYEEDMENQGNLIKKLPVLPFVEPVKFLCAQDVEKDDKRDVIAIRQNGWVVDGQTMQDKPITGGCEINYSLDASDFNIKSIEGIFQVKYDDADMVTINVLSYLLEERFV